MSATSLSSERSTSAAPGLTRSQRRWLSHGAIHLLLWFVLLFLFVPLAWALSTSLKPVGDLFIYPPKWIPDPVQWSNYIEATKTIPFMRYLGNTTIITLFSIIGKLFSVTLVAFAFARLKWWGRDVLFI